LNLAQHFVSADRVRVNNELLKAHPIPLSSLKRWGAGWEGRSARRKAEHTSMRAIR